MRLLRLEDGGEFSLVEYIGNSIPPYAILSHTWGADEEEVTFKDMTKGTAKDKLGYRKLTFCAKQAAKDKLSHFWVDTCSIAKSSSAELSEAINSMYHWYHASAKCYVYLPDVSTSGFADKDQSFQKSRWFTRGWTLQELLAPTSIEFFSVEGDLLGDRNSLVQELADITGISIKALQGTPLSQFSVDERMSWTRGRQTKRGEDMAYSLLGIFDIHMPLIYGEGQDKALKRLHKEIRESSMNQGPNLSPRPSSTVPFSKDRDFVDRPKILAWIGEICTMQSARVAIVGLGGVGKSQIAIQHCYNVRATSAEIWVFWVHAGTQARFEEGYRRIAEATKMPGWDNPKADVLRLVRSWLCDELNGQWLMVIDNADDSGVFFSPVHRSQAAGQEGELLSDFLPQSPNGSSLITSRNRDVASRLTGSHSSIMEVKPMDKNEALELFEKKLGSLTQEHEAIELLAALDYMPLAISQAAAFIAQRAPRMTVARYLEEIRKSDRDRARLLSKDVGDSRRDGKASNSVLATWQISFEHIRAKIPTAARLLSLMCLFDRQGIPEWLLHDRYARDNADGVDFEEDIHTLTSYSLVEMSANGSEFDMHRLVQFSTRKWLELNQELEQWKATYAILLDDNYPDAYYQNWSVCRALFPHVQSAVECRPKDAKALEAWASVLHKTAYYAHTVEKYDTADALGSIALIVRKSLLGQEHPATLLSLSACAAVLSDQGRYREAEEMLIRGLDALRRVYGAEHEETIFGTTTLAEVYKGQGKWKEAEELQTKTLQICLDVLGEQHPHTLINMHSLVELYNFQGRWFEAEVLGVQTYRLQQKLGDFSHTLASLCTLAWTYREQGRLKEAMELQVTELKIRTSLFGEENPSTLTSMDNLAAIYGYEGLLQEAEELQMRVMEISRKVLGEEDQSTLTRVHNLTVTWQYQGRWEEAEELGARVIEQMKIVLGEEHPTTLKSMDSLSITYRGQDRLEEALLLLEKCVQLREKVIGPHHPDTEISQQRLAEWHKEKRG